MTNSERYHDGASNWIEYRDGDIPERAFIVGGNAIGRGWYRGGQHIGYIIPNHGLIVGYGGKEIALKQYEVFIGDPSQYRWLGCSGPCHPQYFVPYLGGHEADGRELYVAKCWHNDREFVGKTGPHMEGGMSFGLDGYEVTAPNYQVLSLLG